MAAARAAASASALAAASASARLLAAAAAGLMRCWPGRAAAEDAAAGSEPTVTSTAARPTITTADRQSALTTRTRGHRSAGATHTIDKPERLAPGSYPCRPLPVAVSICCALDGEDTGEPRCGIASKSCAANRDGLVAVALTAALRLRSGRFQGVAEIGLSVGRPADAHVHGVLGHEPGPSLTAMLALHTEVLPSGGECDRNADDQGA